MSRRRVSWSELPLELLVVIVDRLDTQAHVLQFRAVCTAWRRSAALSRLSSKHVLSPFLPHKFSANANNILYKDGITVLGTGSRVVLVATSAVLLKSALNPKHPPWFLSVEERNTGKLCLREPLSRVAFEKLPESFPRVLDLSQFQVSELGRFYTLRVDCNSGDSFKVWIPFNHKVLLYVDPKFTMSHTIDDYSALVLYADGILVDLRLKHNVCHGLESSTDTHRFDDIVNYRGNIYAIDRKGRLYMLKNGSSRLERVVEVAVSNNYNYRIKCLVVWGDELYLLVCRGHIKFERINFDVFKLNDKHKIWKWDEVQGIGDDKILFATSDGCFFASANDFQGWKGNCIVFHRGCFSPYNGVKVSNYEIFVFHFDGRTCGSIKSIPAYSDAFRLPPSWFLADVLPHKSHNHSDSACESNSSTSDSDSTSESLPRIAANLIGRQQKYQTSRDSNSSSESDSARESPTLIAANRISRQRKNDPVQVDLSSDSGSASESPSQIAANNVTSKTFEGVDVSSQSVQVLRKIWDKHGNIIQGHTVRSSGLLTWALDSLAKMVILIQTNSGSPITDSEADFLESTLLDLCSMNFKLDWLTPFVNKALDFRKSEERMRVKTELESKKRELLAELQEVEERLVEQTKLVAESLSVLPHIADLL